jgi:hypothetical protein
VTEHGTALRHEDVLLRHLKTVWPQHGMLERDQRVIDVFEHSDGTALHVPLPNADRLTGKALARAGSGPDRIPQRAACSALTRKRSR